MKGPLSIFLAAGFVLATASFAGCATTHKPYDDPDALAKLILENSEPYTLVDVRTPEEYASGHIPTAVNIPVNTIADHPPTQDKAALIIVYCQSGGRSATAKKTLDGMGYTRVVNFGSVTRWKGALVEGDSPVLTDFDAKESDFQAYRTWTKVNIDAVTGDAFGVLGPAHEAADGLRDIYVNVFGKSFYLEACGCTFPIGAIIVKEAYKKAAGGGKGELASLAMMVKRGEGFDPPNGNWEYFKSAPDLSGMTRGKLAGCAACHVVAKSWDFVFNTMKNKL